MNPLRTVAASCLASLALLAAAGGAAAVSDGVAPTLAALSVTPSSVDVTAGPATLSVAYEVADDLSGAKSITVTVGATTAEGACESIGTRSRTESFAPATSRSGTVEVTIPRHARSGDWTVCNVEIADQTGNLATLSPVDFDLLGFPHDFAVVSDPDTTPPVLSAFGPLPTSVDTTGGNASFDVPATVTDDLSGVVTVTPIVGPASGGECTGSLTSVLENPLAPASTSASLALRLEIPAFRPADEPWAVCEVEIRDAVGNVTRLATADLAALGFPTTFGVVSDPDTTAPTITSFTLTPSAVDTDDAAATLDVSWAATDDLSGVRRAVLVVGPAGCGGAYQQVSIREVAPSNDASDSFQVTIPRWSAEGPWEVCALLVVDGGDNFAFLDSTGLAAAGFPSGFVNAICGDAIPTFNEACDDGAANGTEASCCTSTCTFKPAGAACAGDADPCSDDVCSGTGACEHPGNGECVSSRSIIAEVGSGGGTIVVPDGSVTLVVPPGAVGAPTQVVLKGIEGLSGNRVVGPVEVGPPGLSFATDATLSITWPDANGDGDVDGIEPLAREAALSVERDGTAVTDQCRLPEHRPASCGAACCDQAANRWTVPTPGSGTFEVVANGCDGGIGTMRLTIGKLAAPTGDETLAWQGSLQLPPDAIDDFDPRATGLRLRLDDGGATVLDVLLPAAKWTANRAATTWKFSPGKGTPPPGGILVAVLKADKTVPGLLKFVVKGKNGDFTVGAGLTASILVDGGECFASGPGAPPPVPACSHAGSKVLCR